MLKPSPKGTESAIYSINVVLKCEPNTPNVDNTT